MALLPGAPSELRDRGVTRYQLGDHAGVLKDLRTYLAAGALSGVAERHPVAPMGSGRGYREDVA